MSTKLDYHLQQLLNISYNLTTKSNLMSKIDKAIARLRATPKDFAWDELKRVMAHFGFDLKNGTGARVKFVHSETMLVINLHQPHPGNIVARVYVQQVLEKLIEHGYLSAESGDCDGMF